MRYFFQIEQEKLLSPWILTQWFFPSSPARLLAKQVYRPASSTFKENINQLEWLLHADAECSWINAVNTSVSHAILHLKLFLYQRYLFSFMSHFVFL